MDQIPNDINCDQQIIKWFTNESLIQKLKEMQMISQTSEQIILKLIEGNFLNEERFAMAYVRGKFRIKKWGKRRLVSELKQRQISKYIINKAINQISEDYIRYLPNYNYLIEGTIEILEYLKEKYILHIITNGFEEVQNLKLEKSGIKKGIFFGSNAESGFRKI